MEFGFREILLVLVIILLLFGAKRIPEMMKAMGQGVCLLGLVRRFC